jgi:hypothetical protein
MKLRWSDIGQKRGCITPPAGVTGLSFAGGLFPADTQLSPPGRHYARRARNPHAADLRRGARRAGSAGGREQNPARPA